MSSRNKWVEIEYNNSAGIRTQLDYYSFRRSNHYTTHTFYKYEVSNEFYIAERLLIILNFSCFYIIFATILAKYSIIHCPRSIIVAIKSKFLRSLGFVFPFCNNISARFTQTWNRRITLDKWSTNRKWTANKHFD